MTQPLLRLFPFAAFMLLLIPTMAWAGLWGAKWQIEKVPNPMTNPVDCGRPKHIQHSAVCDPDHLMTTEEQDVVEACLNNATGIEIAVVLLNYMDVSLYGSDVDETAKQLAMGIHNKWGVGDKVKQDGVLVLISKGDRAVFISTGAGIRAKLSDKTLDKIIARMKPHLSAAKWDAGFASAIYDIDHAINHGYVSFVQHNKTLVETLLDYIMPFTILGFIGFAAFFHRRDLKRMKNLTQGRAALDSLMTDVRAAERRVFMSSSCPMCLEAFPVTADYDSSERQTSVAAPSPESISSTLVPKALACGHVFCEECIKQYLSVTANATCPICRETVRHIDEAGIQPTVPEDHSHVGRRSYSRHHARHHSQTMLYRIRRMHILYPSAMDTSTRAVLEEAIHTDSLSDAATVIETRSVEVQTQVAALKKKMSSASSSGSSRSSFGGGRSSGGRGGRF